MFSVHKARATRPRRPPCYANSCLWPLP